ncbi:toll/interleukin-1 receptor domain-containing protein [Sandarakinorhabdus sp.]|uniref:toll/interleukin-1 receptor domain-containing protein n=1 Tax=Sandarakinorhabdus sp. TaxID=1916663 RepID=UPI00286E7DA5|nr:toll/interleukin-1 receptor domain-containing protein [Sandarakinorhabdus sp.]
MDTAGTVARYRAFISYSHRDDAVAARLHRRLERYRLPGRLAGGRLAPIFRDLEELSAADSLSAAVEAALADSASLVVLCSPDAAASPWVGREIALFRRLHPDRPVLAAMVAGDASTAFPQALLAGGAEPLAADLTGSGAGWRLSSGAGWRLGFLKLVAGIAGVRLDDLVQRDAQARIARVTAITVAAVAAMLVMGALTVFALSARQEAERQRAEAEGLVEFMLTDLREKLRGVGRTDVLASASARALGHYEGQDLARLPAADLERRARALHALGEDEQERGNQAGARRMFAEAARSTAALLAEAPRDAERVFAHAQSVYWVGQLALDNGDMAGAEAGFGDYDRLTQQLLALKPAEPRSLEEAGYGAGNLCTLRLEQKRSDGLIALCQRALDQLRAAADAQPGNAAIRREVANRHGWLADAWRFLGKPEAALAQREAQARVLAMLKAGDPENRRLARAQVWNERAIALLEWQLGRDSRARARLAQARAALAALVAADPDNREMGEELAKMNLELRSLTRPANY